MRGKKVGTSKNFLRRELHPSLRRRGKGLKFVRKEFDQGKAYKK